MGTNPDKVAVAISGAVSVGDTSATAPTGTASELTGFVDLGGISEEGVTRTHPGPGESNVLKYWQNGATARVLRKTGDDPMQIKFTLMETTIAAVEAAFDVTVTQTATEGSYVINAGKVPTVKSLVLDVIDGAELERQYAPQASCVGVGDVTYNGDDSVNLELTFDVDVDATIEGHIQVWSTRLKTVV